MRPFFLLTFLALPPQDYSNSKLCCKNPITTFRCLRYCILYKESILAVWFQVQISEQLEVYRMADNACVDIWIQNLKHLDNSHLNHLSWTHSIFFLFFFLFIWNLSFIFLITDLSGDFNVFFKLCLRREKIILFQIGSKNWDPFDANVIRFSVVRLYNFHNLFWLRVQLRRYFTSINKFTTLEFWHGVFVLSLRI